MTQVLTPDLCVIGGGAGGLAVAMGAAAFGVPVVLIEKARMGGNRLNTGCVPSKALIAAAARAESARGAPAFGVKTGRLSVEFHEVNDHVQHVIGGLAPSASRERLVALGIRVLEGEGRFLDRNTVGVGEDVRIRARRFVIATGCSPEIPEIPGLERTPYLTTDTIFDARALPRQLIIVGAGPVGLELAQAFARMGSEVLVLDAGEPLDTEDAECARLLCDALASEGVVIRSGITIDRVRRIRNKVEIALKTSAGEELIEGSDLLIATGRKPVLDALDLAAAGIKSGPGGVSVNARMRTRNRRVYAIGDAAGSPQFTHVATHQAGLVIQNALFRRRVRFSALAVPRVIYTAPELAQVGLTEAQARTRRRSIRILRWPFHDNDRAQTDRRPRGQIKVVTDRRGIVLGATIVGESAGELITPWTLAVSQRMNIRVFAEIVVPYPTLSEIGQQAAITSFTAQWRSPWLRRMLRWLRLLG